MSKVRVVFLGTPEFAVQSLQALLDDEHYEVVGVVSQPDRPAGRKLLLTPSPVKVLALRHGITVLTPESLKQNSLIVEEIRRWGAEVAIVVAFGQILTEDFIKMFTFGAVNVHGSLLPRWRGAAPIQRAIEAGDRESGVTLQKLVKKLDAGDVIGLRRVPLEKTTTAKDLYAQLADLGADLLRVELMDYIRGNLAALPQDEANVTLAKKIDKSEALIDWNRSATELDCKIRAFNTGPGTYTHWKGKKIKIHGARVSEGRNGGPTGFLPGTVVGIDAHEGLQIQTGLGCLWINQVQPESRSVMTASEFLQGHKDIAVGSVFT